MKYLQSKSAAVVQYHFNWIVFVFKLKSSTAEVYLLRKPSLQTKFILYLTERDLHKITEPGAPRISYASFPQQTAPLNWSQRKNSAFII